MTRVLQRDVGRLVDLAVKFRDIGCMGLFLVRHGAAVSCWHVLLHLWLCMCVMTSPHAWPQELVPVLMTAASAQSKQLQASSLAQGSCQCPLGCCHTPQHALPQCQPPRGLLADVGVGQGQHGPPPGVVRRVLQPLPGRRAAREAARHVRRGRPAGAPAGGAAGAHAAEPPRHHGQPHAQPAPGRRHAAGEAAHPCDAGQRSTALAGTSICCCMGWAIRACMRTGGRPRHALGRTSNAWTSS